MAIDLKYNGVSEANDLGDADIGPNGLQNYPVIDKAVAVSGGTLVQGVLDSTPNSQFTIEFFSDSACHSSGHGEGAPIGSPVVVTTDATGHATFSTTLPAIPAGSVVSATATQNGTGASEFSACRQVVANDPPVATDDTAVTDEDVPVTIPVLANDTDVDGDPLTVTNLTQPANGSVVANPDGTVTYTPNPNWFGTDTFTYTANDGTLDSNVATVTVTVNPVNDPPVAVVGPDQVLECTSPDGTPATLDGSGSYDIEGDPLTYLWSAPGVVFDDPTAVTPVGLFPLGSTPVTLVVNDGQLDSLPASLTVLVQDTTAPQVTAEWVPLKDEGDAATTGKDHKGRYRLAIAVTDVCDQQPTVHSVLRLPLNDQSWEVEFKESDKVKIKLDPNEGKAEIAAPDPRALWQQLLTDGGLAVSDGQVVQWKQREEKIELRFEEDGTLKLSSPLPVLEVTATDASQNSVTVTASPPVDQH